MTTQRTLTPAVPITDARFVYTPSHQTDIRKTFERVRLRMRREPADTRPSSLHEPSLAVGFQSHPGAPLFY